MEAPQRPAQRLAADMGEARVKPYYSEAGITIYELVPTDESLESVFAYLVAS